MNYKTITNVFAVGLLLLPLECYAGTVFNVKSAPYNASGDGVQDDTKAIQAAMNDAAVGKGNTVVFPAGTYLIAQGPVGITKSDGLTIKGAGNDKSMIWYTRAKASAFNVYNNNNVTVEDLSADVQKLPTGLYDLGETQGTITAVDIPNKKVSVKIEKGYPLLSRSDIVGAPTSHLFHVDIFWTQSVPDRPDMDVVYSMPNFTNIEPSDDGTTGVVTVTGFPLPMFVGEKFMIYTDLGSGLLFNIGNGTNTGTTTIQRINFYGGAVNWMGTCDYNMGTVLFDHLYCGPPPYQPDRLITCNEGWAMSLSEPAATVITNSTFLRTGDDIFDIGCDSQKVLSQVSTTPTQIVVEDGNGANYHVGDLVEMYDDKDEPHGAIYGQSKITDLTRQADKNWLITLTVPNIVVKNPGQDFFTDLSGAGPITAINDTFNSSLSRNLLLRSGVSVTVKGCRFEYDTPLVIGGDDDGEGPSEVSNVTVENNIFYKSQGVSVGQHGGKSVSGSNVTITGNKFIKCGKLTSSGGNTYLPSEPLAVSNVNGVTIATNFFDTNWGVNMQFNYDVGIAVTGNRILNPNQDHPAWANTDPDDQSVIYVKNTSGLSFKGNIVRNRGRYSKFLVETAAGVENITGIDNGINEVK